MVDYSQRDLICLHLAAHDGVNEASPAPRSGTAAGIGDALELGGSAAERVGLLDELASLKADGLVDAEERPVRGRDAPRTVYRLTEEGRSFAASVRETLEAQTVELADEAGEQVPLSEIDRYLEAVDAPLVTALARMTADGRVPLEQYVGEAFVDHQEPLSQIEETVQASFRRESRTVLVDGAPGMGKTALIEEAVRRVRADRDSLVRARGSCDPEPTTAYEPIREAMESLPNGESLRDRLDSAQETVTPDDREKVQAQRTALFNDIADGLRRASVEAPVLFVLDDLQWADEATAALFDHLAQEIDELVYPIAFVGAYRASPVAANDELPFAQLLPTLQNRETVSRVTLEELNETDTRALLASELGRQRLPEEFVAFVHRRTGGNPLFVRETATHLLETDRVNPVEGRYPTSEADIVLPAEVTDQIEQRLSALDDDGRALLRLAAVIGSRVPGQLLDAVNELPAATRREYLDVFAAGRLLQPASVGDLPSPTVRGDGPPVAADGSGDFQFVSEGIREAVLEQAPAETVRRNHQRVAAAFTRVHRDNLDDYAARVAHHYEQAGETERAVEFYRRAAEQATNAYANEDALENYGRALDLGTAADGFDAESLAPIRRELSETYRVVGDADTALDVLEAGLDAVPPKSTARARLLGTKAAIQVDRGEYDVAHETATAQRRLAESLGAEELLAEALRQLGSVEMRLSEYARAETLYEESLDICRETGDRTGEAETLNRLGIVLLRQGNLDAAVDRFEESRTIRAELGDEYGESKTLNNLGLVADDRGEMERAREYFEESLERSRARGDRLHEARTLNNLGLVARKRGEMEHAREYFEESLEQAREIGGQGVEALALVNLGLIARKADDLDRGERQFTDALEVAREIGSTHRRALALVNLGIIERKRGNYDDAETRITESLSLAEEIGDPGLRAEALTNLARLERDRGADDAATDHFEDALGIHREAGDRHGEAAVLKELGELAAERGELEAAQEQLAEAAEQALDIGTEEAADTVVVLIDVCERLDETAAAVDWCERAAEFARGAGRDAMLERVQDRRDSLDEA